MLDALRQDFRFAYRALARRPAFAATAVTALALGIGANTAIWSVARGVLLRPLPYAEPGRLVELWPRQWINKRGAAAVEERMTTLAGSTAWVAWTMPLAGDGQPEVVTVARVSARHFQVLGVSPALGRTFAPEESRPGAEKVAIVSWDLWQRRYGGDPGLVGRLIELDGTPYTVVGVLPRDHRSLQPGWQVWIPLVIDPADARDFGGSFYLNLTARLAPGATAATAEDELRALAAALRDENPQTFNDDRVESAEVMPLHRYLVGETRTTLLLLLAAVGVTLLVACADVSHLLLARAAGRGPEMALRTALGASRGRLVRQLLAESLLLGGAGAVVALVGASWLVDLLRRALPADLPRAGAIALDGPVLAATLAAAGAAALLFGFAPALVGSRADLRTGLGEGGAGRTGAVAGSRRGRLAAGLIVGQVAASAVLLVAAALLLQSLYRLRAVDPGFRADGVLAMKPVLPEARYAEPAQRLAFYDGALERLLAVPGVADVGAIHLLPLGAGNWRFPYRYEGQVLPTDAGSGVPLPSANFRVVTPGYFRTLQIPLVRGRDFTAADRADGAAVTVVNRTLARRLWPDEDPVGKRIWLFGNQEMAVVGVVGDVHQHALGEEPEPELYRPLAQWPDVGSLVFVVRAEGDPRPLAAPLRAALAAVDPAVPVADVRPFTEVVAEASSQPRFVAAVTSAFALVALALGALGLYGVLSGSVARRRGEIGVRMALGASRGDVLGLVLRRGLGLAALGLAAGLAVAAELGRFVASLLFGVGATDGPTYAAVTALLAAVALASTWLPARRASAVDPARAIRNT